MGIKGIFIIVKSLHVEGITLFPFVLAKRKQLVNNPVFINHERIHLHQQAELLVIPFYLLYLLFYLFNLIKYRNHRKAYRNIPFEREAYAKEEDLTYLHIRKWFGWLTYAV